jgi:hypothetical protein
MLINLIMFFECGMERLSSPWQINREGQLFDIILDFEGIRGMIGIELCKSFDLEEIKKCH